MKKLKGAGSNQKRAQKAARRKAVVAEKKRLDAAPRSDLAVARAAAAHPVSRCVMNEELFRIGIGHVILARTINSARVAFAIYLVDVWCLGVKKAYYKEGSHEQFAEIAARAGRGEENMVDVAPEYARKLVEGAVEYARSLGFAPHQDYIVARQMFGDIDATACAETVVFGSDGKPLFVSGPNDTPAMIRRTMNTLAHKVGDDGFHYMIGAEAYRGDGSAELTDEE